MAYVMCMLTIFPSAGSCDKSLLLKLGHADLGKNYEWPHVMKSWMQYYYDSNNNNHSNNLGLEPS